MDIKSNKRPYNKIALNKKATKENFDAILKDIYEGSTYKHAAISNLISENYFYELIKQGIWDISHGDYDTICAYLAQSLRIIEQKEIKSCRSDIKNSEKGHRGAEWTLEKVYWREFCGDAKLMELAREIELEVTKNYAKENDNDADKRNACKD